MTIMRAKKTTLKHRMHVDDDTFVDFVSSLLTYDQMARPSAVEALRVRVVHSVLCTTSVDMLAQESHAPTLPLLRRQNIELVARNPIFSLSGQK